MSDEIEEHEVVKSISQADMDSLEEDLNEYDSADDPEFVPENQEPDRASRNSGEEPEEGLSAAGLSTVIEVGKGTDGKCGRCTGCKRDPCRECSACERRDYGNCIDTYCLSDESGRAQRLAMKELYIRTLAGSGAAGDRKTPTLPPPARAPAVATVAVAGTGGGSASGGVKKLANTITSKYITVDGKKVVIVKKGDFQQQKTAASATASPASSGIKRKLENQENKSSSGVVAKKSSPFPNAFSGVSPKTSSAKKDSSGGSTTPKARNTNYVYGSGKNSSKSRRCGECEGCMKDDCGECLACLDKPKFGGKGTKKRACQARVCRMKQMKRSLEGGAEAESSSSAKRLRMGDA